MGVGMESWRGMRGWGGETKRGWARGDGERGCAVRVWGEVRGKEDRREGMARGDVR